MTGVVWFEGYWPGLRDEVGGKAASLGELWGAGLPVPPGFAVTTAAYRRAAADARLADAVAHHLDGVDVADAGGLAARCGALRAAVASMPLPGDVAQGIATAYAELCRRTGEPDVPVAVRSSASGEDSAEASYAGEHDTYLWVCGADAVVAAVRRCWASLFTERATAYRSGLGIDHRAAVMGVVVQKMVRPRTAGVAFTLNPADGDRSQVAIDAAWGFGEGVVSGEVTPDHFLVDKVLMQVGVREVSRKDHAFLLGPGGVAKVPLEERLATAPSLTDAEVLAVARLARAVERHHGAPQDVEWALEGDAEVPDDEPAPILLQSRPETYWSRRPPAPVADPAQDFMAGIVATLVSPLHERPPGQVPRRG